MALGLLDAPRTRFRQVGGHADLEPGRMARVLRGEEVKVSRLLVDHLARARRGALDREIAVRGASDDVLRGGIARVEIELAIPIGEEIQGLADPHWLGVVAAAGRLGDLHVREVGQLQHPDPRRGAAPIVLPLAKPLPKRRVRQQLPVRRDRAHVAGRNRKRLGNASLDAHGKELRMPARKDRALRGEEHLAVGREAPDDVVSGMPRQALGLAPFHRNHVDVNVAVVTAR